MTISFSGLASGMDTASWVEALVSVKQNAITKLESNQATISAAQDQLAQIKSFFESFRSILEGVTESKYGLSTTDIFVQNLAESSNAAILTAMATPEAENKTYTIEVDQLATCTEVNSGIKDFVTTTVTSTATLDAKLFSLGDNIVEGDITFNFDPDATATAGDPKFNRSVHVDANSTIQSFLDDLKVQGVDANYNEQTGIFTINMGLNRITDGTKDGVNGGLIKALNLTDVNNGYQTDVLDDITTTTVSGTATLDSELRHLGVTDASYRIVQVVDHPDGDTKTTILADGTIETTKTLAEFFQTLQTNYGITGTISEDGIITLTSDKATPGATPGTYVNGYILEGDLADALGLTEINQPYIQQTKMTSTDVVYSHKWTTINRDSTLAQIGAIQNAGDTLIIYNSTGLAQATIASLTTASSVQEFFNVLSDNGITAKIEDGVIMLSSNNGNYIGGNIATNLRIQDPIIDTYYTTKAVTMTSSSNIDTSKTLSSLGMSSDSSMVIYNPTYGVVSININKELTVQQFCQKVNDSNYAIAATYDANGVTLTALQDGAYVKGMSQALKDTLKLNTGEDLSFDTTTINVHANTDSSFIQYDDPNVEVTKDTTINTIVDYSDGTGTTAGKLLLHKDGELLTISIDSTLTLEELISNPIVGLAQYGLKGEVLSDGKVYLTADSDIWLSEIKDVSGNIVGSNLLTALKMTPVVRTEVGQHTMQTGQSIATVVSTTTVMATETTELWKYNDAGNIVNGSLVFKVNDYYRSVEIEDGETFGSLAAKLKEIGIDAYVVDGKFTIASGYGNIEYIGAQSTSHLNTLLHGALDTQKDLGGYSASSTTVLSTIENERVDILSASNYADLNTKLSASYITPGELTIYNNGIKKTIMISENTTYADFRSLLSGAFSNLNIALEADGTTLKDGKLTITSSDPNAIVSIGATSDTTNFAAITGLAQNEDGSLTSSRALYKVNENTALGEAGLFRNLGATGKIQAGSFKVGGETIYITEDPVSGEITTTIADIVAQINASEKSLATAYWDNIDGKLVIKSTVTGASAVNIEAESDPTKWTNFTDALGLTSSKDVVVGGTPQKQSNLILDTQNIGSNARVRINGITYTSLTNDVSSSSTGLVGLTINLKGLTNGTPVTLDVKKDTETVTNTISNVLDAYNTLMDNLSAQLSGSLKDQSLLKLISNNIRTTMMSSDAGTDTFKNLAAIGITASDPAASNISTTNDDIVALKLDKDKFLSVFDHNEDEIKALLVGSKNPDGSVKNQGIFTKIYKIIDDALNYGGYFTTANKSFEWQKENVSKKIVNGNKYIERYRARLEKKFSAMDILIANMQTQYKSFVT